MALQHFSFSKKQDSFPLWNVFWYSKQGLNIYYIIALVVKDSNKNITKPAN